jgi:hypothetical protein
MIDPEENQERAVTKGKKEPWNGEFYVSFGDNRPRRLTVSIAP